MPIQGDVAERVLHMLQGKKFIKHHLFRCPKQPNAASIYV